MDKVLRHRVMQKWTLDFANWVFHCHHWSHPSQPTTSSSPVTTNNGLTTHLTTTQSTTAHLTNTQSTTVMTSTNDATSVQKSSSAISESYTLGTTDATRGSRKETSMAWWLIGVGAGCVFGVVLACILMACLYKYRHQRKSASVKGEFMKHKMLSVVIPINLFQVFTYNNHQRQMVAYLGELGEKKE